MLPHGNTSFVVRVTKLIAWKVTNDNTYTMNQKMKSYFQNFFYTFTSMLFATIVLCNLSNTTKRIFVVNVAYNYKLITKNQLKKNLSLLVEVGSINCKASMIKI
jgi:hypothetical protein